MRPRDFLLALVAAFPVVGAGCAALSLFSETHHHTHHHGGDSAQLKARVHALETTLQQLQPHAPPRPIEPPNIDDLGIGLFGPGYFQVRGPDGKTQYTREGKIGVDGRQRLVVKSAAGAFPLLPMVTKPKGTSRLTISSDGTVTAINAQDQAVAVGRVELARFADDEGLRHTVNPAVFEMSIDSEQAIIGRPGDLGFGVLK